MLQPPDVTVPDATTKITNSGSQNAYIPRSRSRAIHYATTTYSDSSSYHAPVQRNKSPGSVSYNVCYYFQLMLSIVVVPHAAYDYSLFWFTWFWPCVVLLFWITVSVYYYLCFDPRLFWILSELYPFELIPLPISVWLRFCLSTWSLYRTSTDKVNPQNATKPHLSHPSPSHKNTQNQSKMKAPGLMGRVCGWVCLKYIYIYMEGSGALTGRDFEIIYGAALIGREMRAGVSLKVHIF